MALARFLSCTVWLILVCSLGLVDTLLGAQVSVSMPPDNTVSGPRIILGDIAFIDVLNPKGKDLAARLKRVDLGAAPGAGSQMVLNRGQLEGGIKSSRLNLGEVVFSLPEQLTLTGRGQEFGEDGLRIALEKYLAGTEPYRSGRYKLVTANFGALPILPPGRVSYRFVPQNFSNPTNLTGTFFFAVDGEEVGRARATAQIELSVPVAMATRALPRDHVFQPGDLALGWVPFARSRGAITDPKLALGQTLKNALNAQEVLTERNLTKSLLVRRGEVVSIIARQGGLKVTATGEARQDGALGDTITVLNVKSRAIITGRITGPSQVDVLF